MRQRDVMMCLHENGSISARVRRKTKEVQIETSQTSGDFGGSIFSLLNKQFLFFLAIFGANIFLCLYIYIYCVVSWWDHE